MVLWNKWPCEAKIKGKTHAKNTVICVFLSCIFLSLFFVADGLLQFVMLVNTCV